MDLPNGIGFQVLGLCIIKYADNNSSLFSFALKGFKSLIFPAPKINILGHWLQQL